MIVFNRFWDLIKERGLSTYWLQFHCGLDTRIIRRLRNNDNIETKTLSKLCTVLDCKLEDIAEFVKDTEVD